MAVVEPRSVWVYAAGVEGKDGVGVRVWVRVC